MFGALCVYSCDAVAGGWSSRGAAVSRLGVLLPVFPRLLCVGKVYPSPLSRYLHPAYTDRSQLRCKPHCRSRCTLASTSTFVRFCSSIFLLALYIYYSSVRLICAAPITFTIAMCIEDVCESLYLLHLTSNPPTFAFSPSLVCASLSYLLLSPPWRLRHWTLASA